jgi:site-specific DNA recombinase
LERPALLRLLEVVRSRGIDRLVIYRLDRLTRNLKHFTTLFEELKNNDVELDVATAPETGAAALDTLMLNILASFSEFERDLAASRIAESRAHLKAHGRRPRKADRRRDAIWIRCRPAHETVGRP